jgi:pimeloyl-ACP methyl ester carboxylesterase
MLVGDSGGSLVAGLFAATHPESVGRLVLFAPVTPFSSTPAPQAAVPDYAFISPIDLWAQLKAWSEAAGEPAALDDGYYQNWADTYLHSDPTSQTRHPPTVKIPNGRQADLQAIGRGRFTFDPTEIRAPTLIVVGEADAIATVPGAQWLLKSLTQARSRRLVVIGHASHTIQFESERHQLYTVVADFLKESQ